MHLHFTGGEMTDTECLARTAVRWKEIAARIDEYLEQSLIGRHLGGGLAALEHQGKNALACGVTDSAVPNEVQELGKIRDACA